MKSVFKSASPYADDVLNLPVASVDGALSFYQNTMGFELLERRDEPCRSVLLARDDVKIGLAENGGDPEQEGCFFEVDNLEAAFVELYGREPGDESFRLDRYGETCYRVFFVIAPDGLCYCLGERQHAAAPAGEAA